MIDYWTPTGPLGQDKRRSKMTLKEASRAAVKAFREGDEVALIQALDRLDYLCGDDAPPPRDLAAMAADLTRRARGPLMGAIPPDRTHPPIKGDA